MRFEIYVLLGQLFIILPILVVAFNLRLALSSIALCIYGPAASIVKLNIGPAVLPSGSFFALIGIVFLILSSPVNKKLFIYITAIFFSSLIASFLGSGLQGIVSAAHFLLYCIFGLLLGNYISRFSKKDKIRFSKSLILCASASFLILIMLRFYGTYISNTLVDMRDVGFGMLPIFLIFLILLNGPSLKTIINAIIPFAYLLLSLTRSYLLDLILVVFYARRRLIKGVFFKPLIYGIVAMSIALIFILRASSSSNPVDDYNQEQYEEIAQVFTLTTRLNGLIYEWNDFINSPIYGNGIAYYEEAFEAFKEQGLDTITDADYIAYNHVGLISVLAQGGIILFFLTLVVPFFIMFKERKKIFIDEDKIMFACMCLFIGYFILFFVSGSPIRKDYTDAILYYFTIGYVFKLLTVARN
jgi:hypothetical protein